MNILYHVEWQVVKATVIKEDKNLTDGDYVIREEIYSDFKKAKDKYEHMAEAWPTRMTAVVSEKMQEFHMLENEIPFSKELPFE